MWVFFLIGFGAGVAAMGVAWAISIFLAPRRLARDVLQDLARRMNGDLQ